MLNLKYLKTQRYNPYDNLKWGSNQAVTFENQVLVKSLGDS